MSIEILQSHSFQVGDVTVSFTISRIGKDSDVEAGARSEVAQVEAAGRGSAPVQVSNPALATISSQDAEVVTPLVHAQPAPAESLGDKISAPTPKPKLSKAEQIRTLRPNCRHADDLDKCAGVGRKHCRGCAAVESEAA